MSGPLPPDTITIELRADGLPWPGGWALLRVPMSAKNDFNLVVGPADDAGVITRSWADVVADCDRQRDLFLMDYGDPRILWSGSVAVEPMDSEAVYRVLDAYRVFGPAFYPPGFESAMRSLRARLMAEPDALLAAELT
jgi:hypothetical protein